MNTIGMSFGFKIRFGLYFVQYYWGANALFDPLGLFNSNFAAKGRRVSHLTESIVASEAFNRPNCACCSSRPNVPQNLKLCLTDTRPAVASPTASHPPMRSLPVPQSQTSSTVATCVFYSVSVLRDGD